MWLDPRHCRPESLLFKALPVPPIAVPLRTHDPGLHGTTTYPGVVRHNKLLMSKLEATPAPRSWSS
jgi:hypothetical protein